MLSADHQDGCGALAVDPFLNFICDPRLPKSMKPRTEINNKVPGSVENKVVDLTGFVKDEIIFHVGVRRIWKLVSRLPQDQPAREFS